MRFDILNTITNIVFSNSLKLMGFLATNTDGAYRIVYEEHEPVVRCYDMSSDTTELTDAEIAKYEDIDSDADVDNMPDGQYVVLCNKYSFKHNDFMYLSSIKYVPRRMVVHSGGTDRVLYDQDKQKFEETTYEQYDSHNTAWFPALIINALDNNGTSMDLEKVFNAVLKDEYNEAVQTIAQKI